DPIVTDSFDVSFQFQISNPASKGPADGLAFVIETVGGTAVGGNRGGLGLVGMSGYAVEMDIVDNGVCGEGSANHIAVDDLTTTCTANVNLPNTLTVNTTLPVMLFGTGWLTVA